MKSRSTVRLPAHKPHPLASSAVSSAVGTTPAQRARAVLAAVTATLVATAGFALTGAAVGASAAEPAPVFSLTSTVDAGDVVMSQALDNTTNRLYFPFDRGTATPGAIGWMDAITGVVSTDVIELADTEPSLLAVSETRHELYVTHYRSDKLTVIDTTTGTVTKVLSGVPAFASALELDTVTGELYSVSDGVTTIDPMAGTVSAEVPVTTEVYPLIKDAVYDATNRMLWISEGRAKVVTGYNTVTDSWMDSIAAPIATFEYNNEAVGGRPSALAVDETLGYLYVGVDPTSSDPWDNTKLITLDTETMYHLGSPIELGDTTRELQVNPETHEIYAANGFSNTLSVVNPATWTVSNTVDFTTAGVTDGTGSANADVWALTVSATGSRAFVSHPYGTARISTIDRVGAIDSVVAREVAPGQTDGVPSEPEVPTTTPWTGPAAAIVSPMPAGAVEATDTSFSWSVSNYAKEWASERFGAVTFDAEKNFIFSGGTGWADPSTGAAQIAWGDGFTFKPYPDLAPDVSISLGNPLLTVAADGSGTVSFDVAWAMSPTATSAGFSRVTVATFGAGETVGVDALHTLTRTPDYIGVSYTIPGSTPPRTLPDSYPKEFVDYLDAGIRAWWYSSGSSLDSTKAPNPITVSYRAVSDEVPTVPEVPEVPGVPEVPEVPEVPGVPEVPEVPIPGAPDVPGNPDVPGDPEIPGTPETPGVDPELPADPDAGTDPDSDVSPVDDTAGNNSAVTPVNGIAGNTADETSTIGNGSVTISDDTLPTTGVEPLVPLTGAALVLLLGAALLLLRRREAATTRE